MNSNQCFSIVGFAYKRIGIETTMYLLCVIIIKSHNQLMFETALELTGNLGHSLKQVKTRLGKNFTYQQA